MTQRIQFLIGCLLFSAISLTAQRQETRTLDEFDKVSVAAGVQAILVKGTTNEIDIKVKNIDLDKVTTEVDDGKLKVTIDNNWLKNLFGGSNRRKVEVVITYTEDLHGVKASSGASLETDGTIVTDRISLGSSSGANMSVTIESGDTKASVSSGASMRARGETNFLEIGVSSGANFNGKKLIAQEVFAKASSGASASVNVEDSLTAKASSGGSITYKGSPKERDINKSSGGSVSGS